MEIVQNDIIATEKQTNELFPVFLKLEQLQVLIVGGGNIGFEKLQAIITNSPAATIVLVATVISDHVKSIANEYPNIELKERPFESSDLHGIDIAVIAINNKIVSEQIYASAKQAGVLTNVADTPDLCDFYLGSVVKKGNLKIAISTNGKSPTIAKRLKETFAAALPDELDNVLDNMQQIRNKLNGNFEHKVKKLNAITKVLVEKDNDGYRWKRIATISVTVFAIMLVGHFIFSYLPLSQVKTGAINLYNSLDGNFPLMLLGGFFAQLVDGALGMGYGVTSTSILLSAGVNPAAISGSIHTAEMFASGASGYSHYKFGNVNKKLFKALVIPGVIGAIAGAILLVYAGEKYSQWIRPVLATYTLLLGIKILITAFQQQKKTKKFKRYGVLAGAGGFLDSFGGGGWGPIVTTTLITKGRSPRFVIGSVSLAEFFVTLGSAFAFFMMLGVTHWQTIVGLILGSLIAAPVAAKLAGKLPRKASFILLGILVIFWSSRILIKLL